MKIKISSLNSSLHDKEKLAKNSYKFLATIQKRCSIKFEFSSLDDYDCDLKLIFIETGGSEGLFLKNISLLKEPYYFLTNGENNSLAASLEIMTYLNSHNLKGEIIHGNPNYISKRINELSKSSEITSCINLGVVGQPSDWLISSIPEYNSVKNSYNINLINIPIDELVNEFNNVSSCKIDKIVDCGFPILEITKAERVYISINNIIKKYELQGITIRCFDLLSKIQTTSCLAFAKLNQEGIVATCEGDIMSMITMVLIKNKINCSSFQANPCKIDLKKNEIVLAHCTIPLDMCKSYKFATHFESNIGVAIKGELFCKDITILRLSSDMKRYFLVEGKIIKNLNKKNLCRTQILVKCSEDISSLLTSPCGNHHIVFYGHHKKKLNNIIEKIIKN